MPEGGNLTEGDIRRWLLSNGLLLVIAGGLAFGASQTSGAIQVALGVVAGVVAAFVLWSTSLTLGLSRLLRITKEPPPQESGPRADSS